MKSKKFPNITTNTNLETNWKGSITTVYDPTFTYALYTSRDDIHWSNIILWDLVAEREITRIFLGFITNLSLPIWTPDNRGVILSAPVSKTFEVTTRYYYRKEVFINIHGEEDYLGGHEFVLLKFNGTLERLSFFTREYYSRVTGWSLSPDGETLAFWLKLDTENQPYYYIWDLATINLNTKELTIYCIDSGGDAFNPKAPVWSPDSKGLMLTLGEDYIAPFIEEEIMLVDLDNLETYKFDQKKLYGIGWLEPVE